MMGSKSSKRVYGDSPSNLQCTSNPQYSADLSSYADACRTDPQLRSFDQNIHQHTNRVINSLASGMEVRSLSFDSLKEITGSLLDMNQEVVNVILESKNDIWNNQEMFPLVEEYFSNSLKTLDFCSALENCLKRARDSQLILQVLVQQFEDEMKDGGIDGKKFLKTLQELKNFKAAGDPFTEEFFALFQSVYTQQMLTLQKLHRQKRKLDKKMKSVKTWRKVSNVIFVTAFVSVLIFSVVAASIAAPPVVTAVAGALAVPIGSVGKWCNSLWKGYENALKGKRGIINSMWVGTNITLKDLENIRALASKLQIQVESLLQNADFALVEEDEVAVKVVMDEIKKKISAFRESIEMLCEQSDKCSRDVRRARTVILQRIIKHPSGSTSSDSDIGNSTFDFPMI